MDKTQKYVFFEVGGVLYKQKEQNRGNRVYATPHCSTTL